MMVEHSLTAHWLLLSHSWQWLESCVGAEAVCVWHPQSHLLLSAIYCLWWGHVQRSQLPGTGDLPCPCAANRWLVDVDFGSIMRTLSIQCWLSSVLSGYRSVPLKNSYSEELELAALLVHIEIVNAKVHGLIFVKFCKLIKFLLAKVTALHILDSPLYFTVLSSECLMEGDKDQAIVLAALFCVSWSFR